MPLTVACHEHGTTLSGFLPVSGDHLVASYGTTRPVARGESSARLLDAHVLFDDVEVNNCGVQEGSAWLRCVSAARLARVDLLILDDFALPPLDATETNDFSELVVERHRKASTIVTSNREPSEWLTMMSDALLAQSAVDRLTAGALSVTLEN